MKEAGRMLLRSKFEAETDIKMSPHRGDWQRYAEWLENLTVREINEKQIEKNEALYELISTTIQMLEEKTKMGLFVNTKK